MSPVLSQMEAIAFGQTSSGTDEERLVKLERKAYGKVRDGDIPQRVRLMQHFMGVSDFDQLKPAVGLGESGVTSVPPAGSGSFPGAAPDRSGADVSLEQTAARASIPGTIIRQPLQAKVSTRQFQLESGDDPRFGGLWVGTLASKIDPHVKVFCELHGAGDHFTGTMIWTSAVCGGCRRTITGSFDRRDQACVMKDTRVEAINQRNSTKFCKVDRYAFGITESAERLSGWFHSSACKDEGAVTLTRYRE